MLHLTNSREQADLAILPFFHGKKGAELLVKGDEFAPFFKPVLDAEDFKGKTDEMVLLYLPKRKKEKRLLLLGLGAEKKLTSEKVRRAYGLATKMALKKECKTLQLFVPDVLPFLPIFEGISLANYAFDQFKKKADPKLKRVSFFGLDAQQLAACRSHAEILSSVHMVRDLVNGNADEVTPQFLVHKAKELGKTFPAIQITALDKKAIEKEKMGLLLAVNRGASQDPALIVLEYRGNPKSKETSAIVGKGITYDTGGLNIKTSQMETMKADMAGAAVVLGVLRAAAALKLPVNLCGVIASTENAIGPLSYKPGDVYISHAGKSVEINNTDAEGRLVLADALSYVQKKHKPSRIIDLATLTGGIVIALGEEVTGLFSNNDRLAEQLFRAGEETFERLWRFPLYQEYHDMLKSPIADLKNSAGRKASSLTAACFLEEFIDRGTPWAHLDIAGTAFLTDPKSYHPTHATGVGVRLLIEFLRKLV